MKKIFRIIIVFALAIGVFPSCNSRPENPNEPKVDIDFTISISSVNDYSNLSVVSGWMYVSAREPSRGIILYRYSQDEIKAYERTPPNSPDACGKPNALAVEYPFVVDGCTDYKYNILDGSIVEGGDGYPMIQYYTQFDGTNLRVYN